MSNEKMTLEQFLKTVGATADDLHDELDGENALAALAAVEQDGWALRFVKRSTFK